MQLLTIEEVAGWVYPYEKKVSDLTLASMGGLGYEVN